MYIESRNAICREDEIFPTSVRSIWRNSSALGSVVFIVRSEVPSCFGVQASGNGPQILRIFTKRVPLLVSQVANAVAPNPCTIQVRHDVAHVDTQM